MNSKISTLFIMGALWWQFSKTFQYIPNTINFKAMVNQLLVCRGWCQFSLLQSILSKIAEEVQGLINHLKHVFILLRIIITSRWILKIDQFLMMFNLIHHMEASIKRSIFLLMRNKQDKYKSNMRNAKINNKSSTSLKETSTN